MPIQGPTQQNQYLTWKGKVKVKSTQTCDRQCLSSSLSQTRHDATWCTYRTREEAPTVDYRMQDSTIGSSSLFRTSCDATNNADVVQCDPGAHRVRHDTPWALRMCRLHPTSRALGAQVPVPPHPKLRAHCVLTRHISEPCGPGPPLPPHPHPHIK